MSASSPAAPRLRRDAERNRQRLLVAARELFAERGLDVSLDDIARRAGVGVATAYRRFPDKEQLIDALFEQRMAEVVKLADEACAHDDAWDGLVLWVTRIAEMQAADRGLKALLISSAHGRERVGRVREQLRPLVTQLLERARAQGTLRADFAVTDIPMVTLMLGVVAGYTGDVAPDAWRRYLTLLLDGLRARRDAPSALIVDALDERQLDDVMRSSHERR